MPKFYDGTRLLSQVDIHGERPEIYMTTTNRSAGKTTFFSRMLVKRFLSGKGKFIQLFRYGYELSNCGETFFKDIGNLFFRGYTMETQIVDRGIYANLYLYNKEKVAHHCGYAIPLNQADNIKRRGHLFVDATAILFDEFQSESNHYCTDEVNKFISIHTSLARGNGEMVRYLPVYMLSNAVSIINPYFIALGISDRLQSNTRYLRGDGFVLEQDYYSEATEARKASGFGRAFSSTSYMDFANAQNVYLNDNLSFIEKPSGKSRYMLTIIYDGKHYGIRQFQEPDLLYVDTSIDNTFPVRLAVTVSDHSPITNLGAWWTLKAGMRDIFKQGRVRFKNQEAKTAFIMFIAAKDSLK